MGQLLRILAVAAVAFYAYYRLATWLGDRCRPHGNAIRYLWPSSMVALCGVSVVLNNLPQESLNQDVPGALLLLGAFLNLPIVPVFCLDGLVVDKLNLGDWSSDALIGGSIWVAWYGVIRLLEWRARCAILKLP